LHLADVSGFEVPQKVKESNNTTDGYILAIGLEEGVLNAFETDNKVTKGVLYKLITQCIPNCFSDPQYNITFEQDKDYLAAYLCASRFWVKHRTDVRLTHVILDRAWKHNPEHFKEVFASWIEAMTKAGGPML